MYKFKKRALSEYVHCSKYSYDVQTQNIIQNTSSKRDLFLHRILGRSTHQLALIQELEAFLRERSIPDEKDERKGHYRPTVELPWRLGRMLGVVRRLVKEWMRRRRLACVSWAILCHNGERFIIFISQTNCPNYFSPSIRIHEFCFLCYISSPWTSTALTNRLFFFLPSNKSQLDLDMVSVFFVVGILKMSSIFQRNERLIFGLLFQSQNDKRRLLESDILMNRETKTTLFFEHP